MWLRSSQLKYWEGYGQWEMTLCFHNQVRRYQDGSEKCIEFAEGLSLLCKDSKLVELTAWWSFLEDKVHQPLILNGVSAWSTIIMPRMRMVETSRWRAALVVIVTKTSCLVIAFDWSVMHAQYTLPWLICMFPVKAPEFLTQVHVNVGLQTLSGLPIKGSRRWRINWARHKLVKGTYRAHLIRLDC